MEPPEGGPLAAALAERALPSPGIYEDGVLAAMAGRLYEATVAGRCWDPSLDAAPHALAPPGHPSRSDGVMDAAEAAARRAAWRGEELDVAGLVYRACRGRRRLGGPPRPGGPCPSPLALGRSDLHVHFGI